MYEKVQDLSPEGIPNNDTSIAELDRLARATEFISSSVVSAHPFAEFISLNIQNNVNRFENQLNTLNSVQPRQLLNLVTELNNEITQILASLSPYLSQVKSARSAGQAFGNYKKLIENQVAEISAIRVTIDDALKSITTIKDEALSYRRDLLEGTEEQPSIHTDISEKTSQIDKMLSTTESFYQKLTAGDSESASIENQILEARKSAAKNSEEISEKLTDVKKN